MALNTNKIVPPSHRLKSNTGAKKVQQQKQQQQHQKRRTQAASSTIKSTEFRRNSTSLATLKRSCSGNINDSSSSNSIFSSKTTTTISYQWQFFILIFYLFNGYNCEIPAATTADGLPTSSPLTCSSQSCHNGGVCIETGNGNYMCNCPSGWTGRHCTQDIDECIINPEMCGNGICKNVEGSYKCYCAPGFTGIHCDSDVDECLSRPCQNGATCLNKINDYECICEPGFMGLNCEIDINECASNPCSKGSTCIDRINNFNCLCMPGMTGRFCETDIDDCISTPCQHGGRCIDELGGYHCDCASTGFEGHDCEINIDECATNMCTNGAECIDQINDYSCKCHPGYKGKNCEIDINECESNPCFYKGNCLERSNRALYVLSERMDLPVSFSKPFSFANASGYECVCVPGIMGRNCEININECKSNPCTKNGYCIDGIGTYTCECDPGFEGTHCEINIDECERYNPCGAHGTCIDQTNDYDCDCDANYGGKNCSVALTGCVGSPCLNGGFCKPYLINEIEHIFSCICQYGFQGDTCEKSTTISMVVSSLITVKTQREEGYDINLQFKTTLPSGILAFGSSQKEPASYILELINGRLNLHSSLLNRWEGIFIGSNLNDSAWHKVIVAINTSHLVLSADDEQAIYPVGSYETANGSQPSFSQTYLGTIPNLKSFLRHLIHPPTPFVGCMQDIVVNGKWIFPEENSADQDTDLKNVQSGCLRTAQCHPNPCHSNGECTDLWHTFSCKNMRTDCGSEEWECDDGQCIDKDDLCNGKVNCNDGTDEIAEYCIDKPCQGLMFHCSYGACITGTEKCNGVRGCADGSDEMPMLCGSKDQLEAQQKGNCSDNFMQCKSGECIDVDNKCDGRIDCTDGSDEIVELCSTAYCPKYSFKCGYGGCIKGTSKCDNIEDCVDGSDEAAGLCNRPRDKGRGRRTITTTTTTTTTTRPPIINRSLTNVCKIPSNQRNLITIDLRGNLLRPGTSIKPNTLVKFRCNPTYTLEGHLQNYCSNYGWINEMPTCYKYCSESDLKSRISSHSVCLLGDSQVPCNDRISPGTKARLDCAPGFNKPPTHRGTLRNELTCLADGSWNFQPYSCLMECGIVAPPTQQFSRGGNKINITAVPWHVGIYDVRNGISYNHICGGTIITPNLIISAAHCFWDSANEKVYNVALYSVVAGKYFRGYNSDKEVFPVEKRNVSEIHVPSGFKKKGGSYNFEEDVAVVKLISHLKFRESIRPVCIEKWTRSEKEIQNDLTGTFAGWGITENYRPSDILQSVSMDTRSFRECARILKNKYPNYELPNDKFCLYDQYGSTACRGDSGGGFVISKRDVFGREYFTLLGVVSHSPSKADCSESGIVVMTNVQWFIEDFIDKYKVESEAEF